MIPFQFIYRESTCQHLINVLVRSVKTV